MAETTDWSDWQGTRITLFAKGAKVMDCLGNVGRIGRRKTIGQLVTAVAVDGDDGTERLYAASAELRHAQANGEA